MYICKKKIVIIINKKTKKVMKEINWNERMEQVENYDYTTLKRMATKWLGKGWRNCNCWASMEALKLAELCKKRLDWFEDDTFIGWESYKEYNN